MLKNSTERYGSIAKGFHWALALVVLGMLPLGFYMVALDPAPFKLALYGWHKSFGTLVLFLVVPRLIWRFAYGTPEHIATHARWERGVAHAAHGLLYLGMIGMPLSGWLMSSAGGFPHSFFGLFAMPDLTGKNKALFDLMRETHEISAFVLLAAVGLHGAGAFKHHVIDRDETLRRMLPGVAPRFGAALAAVLFAACLGGAVFFALTEDEEESVLPVVQAEQTDKGGAAAGWRILPEDSRIGFKAQAQGVDFEGSFSGFSGTIVFDPDDLAAATADVRVNIASVHTGSPERDQYIVMEPWLNAGVFPEARFVSHAFERLEADRYIAHGELTVRGITLPVDMPFSLTIIRDEEAGSEIASMTGSFTMNRLDYGVGAGEWSDPALVAMPLTVMVSIQAVQDFGAENNSETEFPTRYLESLE